MAKDQKAASKSESKKPSRTLAMGAKTRGKAKPADIAKTEADIGRAKPVVLKLPRTLKKAARACAKNQGLKLRAWIVDLIKIQLGKQFASSAAKSLQTP